MKNTIIQGILGAAVIVLFILHFASSKSGNANNAGDNTESPVVASVGEMKIAYVNVDSLVNNLTLPCGRALKVVSRKNRKNTIMRYQLSKDGCKASGLA